MMVNGVQQFNPAGAGGGAGTRGDPNAAARVAQIQASRPWNQPGQNIGSWFGGLNPQQQFSAIRDQGAGNDLIRAGVFGDQNQMNQWLQGMDSKGVYDPNTHASAFNSIGSYNGAVNTGTGLQRGANFGPSMFDTFANAGAQPQQATSGVNNAVRQLGGQSGDTSTGGGGSSFSGGNNVPVGSFGTPGGQVPNGGSFNPYAPVQGGNPLPSWMDQANPVGGGYNSQNVQTGGMNNVSGIHPALQQMLTNMQQQRAYPQGRMTSRIGRAY